MALKKISKRYTTSSSFKTETDALLRIYDNGGHPNISGLRDMYEDYTHYYLILDLVSGGEMFDHLSSDGAYSEADAARLMYEVASALAFLVSKLGNFVLTVPPRCFSSVLTSPIEPICAAWRRSPAR